LNYNADIGITHADKRNAGQGPRREVIPQGTPATPKTLKPSKPTFHTWRIFALWEAAVSVTSRNLLSKQKLEDRGIPWSGTYLLQLERDGRFPKRVPMGEKTCAWVEDEIDQWIAEAIAARISTPSIS
jgi:prophage regulatory protein